MLIPYETLKQLEAATLDNLLKEYLLRQIEDGSLADYDATHWQQALAQCKQALKGGELVVEFNEEDESIGVRRRQDIVQMSENDDIPAYWID